MSIDLTDDTSYVSYGDAAYLTKYFCSKTFPDERLNDQNYELDIERIVKNIEEKNSLISDDIYQIKENF